MKMRRLLSIILAVALVFGITTFVSPASTTSYAKTAKIKLNKTSLKLEKGKSFTLKLKNAKTKKVKWKSSNIKVAKVTKGKVVAKKKGTAIITATYKTKKYKCKVTVNVNTKAPAKKPEDPSVSQPAESTLDAKTNIAKSVAMVDAHKNKPTENVLFSPTSFNMCLGMVANATEGEAKTAAETYLNRSVAEYNNHASSLLERSENSEVVKICNGYWYRNIFSITEPLSTNLSNFYKVTPKSSAMDGNTVNEINEFVDKNTDGMIKQIVDEPLVNASDSIFINTVLFDGKWHEPYLEYQVQNNQDFTNASNEIEKATLLTDTVGNYYESDTATGFTRPYRNGYSFVAILPKKKGEFTLSSLDIEEFLKSQYNEENTIYHTYTKIPKFKYEDSINPTEYLSKNDLAPLFEENGLANQFIGKPSFLTNIIQKTAISLTEEGTKAAAVTGMMSATSALPSPDIKHVYKEVILDRPFAFLIMDNINGEILFVGKVNTVK